MRTQIPLFWLLLCFQAVSGQEIRYCPPYPVKMVIYSALAAPESAACAKTVNLLKIAAAVSAKHIIVQGEAPEAKRMKWSRLTVLRFFNKHHDKRLENFFETFLIQ